MARRAVAMALVVVSTLAACGRPAASPEDPPLDMGTNSSTTASDVPAPSIDATDQITILDPGSEPRRVLRLTPQPGATQRVTVRTDMQQTLGGTFEVTIPIFELDFTRTVTSVGAGQITVEESPFAHRIVDERGADPLVIAELQTAFDAMIDLGANVIVLDERGSVIDSTMMGEAATYEPGRLDGGGGLTGPSLPMPADPVGVGARWQVLVDAVNGGIRQQSTITVELVELHADRAVARTQQVTTLPQSFIDGTHERDEVMGGTITSTGTIIWQFAHALPLGDQSLESSMRIRSFRGASASEVTIDQRIASTTLARD